MGRRTSCLLLCACLAHHLAAGHVEGRPVTRSIQDRSFDRDVIISVPDASRHVSARDAQSRLLREAAGMGRRVIAMSLYGTDPDYLVGAIENAVLVQRDWAGWTLRVYHDATVPAKTLAILRALDVELVPRAGAHADDHAGLFIRFTVLQDPRVTRFLVRDADARLTRRDKHAVDEWIASGRFLHIIRDHPSHHNEIMGGAWGAVGGFIRPAMLDAVMASTAEVPFNEDQHFLGKYVWPHVRHHALTHDAFYCERPDYRVSAWRPFPTRRASPHDFIGNKYMRENEYEGMAIDQDCPVACRGGAGWRQC